MTALLDGFYGPFKGGRLSLLHSLCGHIVLFIHVFPAALTEPILHVA